MIIKMQKSTFYDYYSSFYIIAKIYCIIFKAYHNDTGKPGEEELTPISDALRIPGISVMGR